jgi:PIN domain nuclease of toxin-antitoxin system
VIVLCTNALLWLDLGDARLGRRAREVADQALDDDELWVSATSFCEVAALVVFGSLALRLPTGRWRRELLDRGLLEQPVDGEVATRALELRDFYKDPGDRLIVATALMLGATLVTSDRKILDWPGPLDRIDARR